MKFRKKPVVIEAVQWTGKNIDEIREFMGIALVINPIDPKCFIQVRTLEGNLHASDGDWIIKGVKGEFYPCKPDIFEQTYEEAK